MKDINVLVTGGGSGIGLATAQLFLAQGANVMIAGRSADRLAQAKESCGDVGGRLRTMAGDVGSEGHAKRLINHAVSEFGGLDVLVNNAGVAQVNSIHEMEEEDFDEMLQVNLKGPWFMCKYAVAPLAKSGRGAIVNVSSYLAVRAHASTPSSGYAAAKAGLLGLTRSLAVELAPQKIRVNAVLPAVVNTPMLESMVGKADIPKLLESSKRAHPLGRAGEPIDVARAILFLADPANSWLTGIEMPVDGGRSLV